MGTTPISASYLPTGLKTPFPPVQNSTLATPWATPRVNLVDPITAHRLELDSPFTDKILHLSPWQKLKLDLRNTFVTIPQGVARGLKGDSNFSFSDFLNIAKIPYYAGGVVLALSFLAGRDRRNFTRQALGVVLYYLGVMATHKGIDALYKAKDGVDLDLRFRKANGDIEKVFASANWARFDLMDEEEYQRLMHEMGIPDNVASPHREVQDQLRRIITTSRADKLILGNVLAAIGAGYIARSDAWARLIGGGKTLMNVLRDPNGGHLPTRLRNAGTAFWGLIKRGVGEKITGYAGEPNPWMRKSILRAGAALVAGGLIHCLATGRGRSRSFESPLYTALAPEMNPDFTPAQPSAEKAVYRRPGFAYFEQLRANATVAHIGGRPQ
jgi:hypothetical protein